MLVLPLEGHLDQFKERRSLYSIGLKCFSRRDISAYPLFLLHICLFQQRVIQFYPHCGTAGTNGFEYIQHVKGVYLYIIYLHSMYICHAPLISLLSFVLHWPGSGILISVAKRFYLRVTSDYYTCSLALPDPTAHCMKTSYQCLRYKAFKIRLCATRKVS